MSKELEILMDAFQKMATEMETARADRDYWIANYIKEQRARGKVEDKLKEYVTFYCNTNCDDPKCHCHNDGSAPEPNPIDEHGYEEMIGKTLAKDVGESGEAI